MKTHIFTLACLFTLISGSAFSHEAQTSTDQGAPAPRDLAKLSLT